MRVTLFFCVLAVLLPLHTAAWGVPRGHYPTVSGLRDKLEKQHPRYTNHAADITTSPICSSRDGHKIRCFYKTHNGTIGYTIIADEQSLGSYEYESSVIHQGQTAYYGFSGVFVFFVDKNNEIVCMGIETGTDYDHRPLVLPLGFYLEAPSCVSLKDYTELFCLCRGLEGQARTFRFRDGVWEPGISISPKLNGPIDCDVNPNARLVQCWASYGINFVFGERRWSLHGKLITSRCRSFGEYCRGRPCVKHIGLVAFPRALASFSNEMVDAFGNFGGNLYSEPDCASPDTRTYDCFALTKDSGLQRNYQHLGWFYVRKTSGWVDYGGQYRGKPSCLYLQKDKKYHCFMLTTTNTLMEGTFHVIRVSSSINRKIDYFGAFSSFLAS